MIEKSYNKTVIDFNFGRHKDLSTLKSDIHLGLAASVNITSETGWSRRCFVRPLVGYLSGNGIQIVSKVFINKAN